MATAIKILPEKLIIRMADNNDLEILIENRLKFLNDLPGQEHTRQDEIFLRNSLKEYFSTAIANKSFVAFVAEYNGNIVSFGGMVIRRQPGNYNIPLGKTGYILSMYTVPNYRRNGLGSLIFQKLIDYSKSVNLDRLELHASKDGEPIYRKFGFVPPHDVWLEYPLK